MITIIIHGVSSHSHGRKPRTTINLRPRIKRRVAIRKGTIGIVTIWTIEITYPIVIKWIITID
jgi:hypothetical protein